jgi:N-acyl-D-amino-acid deacylase
VGSSKHPALKSATSRRLSHLAAAVSQRPIDLYYDILVTDNLATSCLMHIGHEENVQAIMQHETHMCGSDAILHGETVHPRVSESGRTELTLGIRNVYSLLRYQAAKIALTAGHYARDLGLMSLEKMISHMTSRPAKRLGVYPHRGSITVGAAADLVLFGPGTVRDCATFVDTKRRSEGLR